MEEMMRKSPEKTGPEKNVRESLRNGGFLSDAGLDGLNDVKESGQIELGDKEVEAVVLPIKPDEIIERAAQILFKVEIKNIQKQMDRLNRINKTEGAYERAKKLAGLSKQKKSLLQEIKAGLTLEQAKQVILAENPRSTFEVVDTAA